MPDGSGVFPCVPDFSLNPLNRVTQADSQHRLAGVLQHIDNAARRIFEKNVPPVGQQVIFRRGANRVHQALAQFTLQKADNSTDLLQRESTIAHFADDGDFRQIVERINTLVALASRNHDAPFIPPLQLSRTDAGEFHYRTGCKGLAQAKGFPETKAPRNV